MTTIGGKEYPLAYTVQAMMEVKRILTSEEGEEKELTEAVFDESSGAYPTFCQILSAIQNAGELYRRYAGHEKGPVLTKEQVQAVLLPWELVEAKKAVMEAVLAGLQREEPEEEVDEGLAELEKKTT